MAHVSACPHFILQSFRLIALRLLIFFAEMHFAVKCSGTARCDGPATLPPPHRRIAFAVLVQAGQRDVAERKARPQYSGSGWP